MSKQLMLLRGINFSFYTTFAALLFLPVFFEEKGYSAAQIGLLMSIGSFVTIFAQPLWGYMSDRYNTLKLIIFGLWVLTILSSLGIFYTTTYTVTFLFMLLFNLFMTSSGPLLDTLTIKNAQKASVSYGSIRLYGSIGFLIIALLSSNILHFLGGFKSMPYLFWGLWILPMYLLFFLKDEKGTGQPISFSALKNLFQNRRLMWFFGLVFILMVPHRMNDALLTLHLKDLGANDSMIGWAWALVAVSEIPTFALLGRYLYKFHELVLLGVVAIFYTIRWALYGFVTDPFSITLFQLINAVTGAAFWIIAVQYVTRIVPEELRSTGQSLLAMVLGGICGITGGYVGGIIKDYFGGELMYQLGALVTASATILIFGTFIYQRKNNMQVKTKVLYRNVK